MQISSYRLDKQQGPTVQHSIFSTELYPISYNKPSCERPYSSVNHFAVWEKLTNTVNQLYINKIFFKKEKENCTYSLTQQFHSFIQEKFKQITTKRQYKSVLSNFIHSSQELEAAHMFMTRRMNQYTMLYLYCGILFSVE